MKLTYWVSECLDDSKAYNLRGRTKREVKRLRDLYLAKNRPENPSWLNSHYGPIHKVVFEYKDGFDLIYEAMSEESIFEGMKTEATPYHNTGIES